MTVSSSKYAPLEGHLKTISWAEVPMSFAEIERIIRDKLPASARKNRPWWSNNPSNSVITKAWLNAGYKTARVDMDAERLVFIKDEAEMLPLAPVRAGQTAQRLAASSFLPGQPPADPADRVLIATARAMDLILITRDQAILDYGQEGWVRTLAC